DILDLSRIEAGRVELQSTSMDLRSAVEDACSLIAPIAAKKKVTIEPRLPDAALMVVADHDRVRQIVVNLLSNAVKFTPANGKVLVVAEKTGSVARVAVEDTGIGISPEDARKLFSPFTQLKQGVNAGGAGLGLSISKRLVELMNGEIGLDSTVGKGSTFHFTVPLAEDATSANNRAPAPAPVKKIAKRRVLVVDGNENRVRGSEELLARAGYDVHVAFNTEAAATELAKEAVDLVVVDLALPSASGFKLVESIANDKATKTLPKSMAVIVLTDRTLSSTERDGLSKSTDLIAEKGVMTGAGFLDAVSGLLEQNANMSDKKPRILVVDDSAINRSVLRAMLESAGFEVVEADRAKEGIRMAQTAPPQVILMDVRMPDMSGLDATRALRDDTRTKATPIIAVSAQAMSGDKELALEAGCNAYVTKPVARQELLSAIGSALRAGDAE
ncbi:MAG TPA: response regulator, partial [Polyangiaceae bacterium]